MRVVRLCNGLLEAQLVFNALRFRDEEAVEVFMAAAAEGVDLVEIETKGASYRQDVLEAISGPKGETGKRMLVGLTLRCEPDNAHDPHAVRIEIMGQHIGYVSRRDAALLGPRLSANCGGAIEARGLVVGGWKHDRSEGTYGVRVWLTSDDMLRIGAPL
jgi:hypothetical protein